VKNILYFYLAVAAVAVTLPVVVTLADRVSGGMFSKLYDATIGAAGSAVAGIGRGATTTASLTAGETGARLVNI
jgi:hypothetical protein